jgi:hypothetical protein
MRAVTLAVPVLLPMVSITVTGFLVPVKLTSCPSASNLYRDAPVGLISTSRPAPPVPEMKVKDPSGCFHLPLRQEFPP